MFIVIGAILAIVLMCAIVVGVIGGVREGIAEAKAEIAVERAQAKKLAEAEQYLERTALNQIEAEKAYEAELDPTALSILATIKKLKSELSLPGVGAKITDMESFKLTESRLGGEAAWPKGKPKPRPKGDIPFYFLAQINLSEMPSISGFPNNGLIQFFGAADDLYGLGLPYTLTSGEVIEGDDFAVVYHPDISDMERWIQFESENEPDILDTPFYYKNWWKVGFKLEFGTVQEVAPQSLDHQISAEFTKLWKLVGRNKAVDEFTDKEFPTTGWDIIIGGHPFFSQDDPRGFHTEFSSHSLNLASFDSGPKLLWGDCGTGSFMIRPQDLKDQNFTNVFGNYDCL